MDLLTPSSPGVFQLCLGPIVAPGYLGGGLPCLSSALWCQYPMANILLHNFAVFGLNILKQVDIHTHILCLTSMIPYKLLIIIIINRHFKMLNQQINCHKGVCSNYTITVWNKAVFSNCLKSLRDKSRLRRWAGISFQAVGPEELKERSPKLAVQDRGTSSLFASAERNRD